MMPYILHILHNTGTPQDIPSICEKLKHFSIARDVSEADIKASTEQALEQALSMGLISRNAANNSYKLAHKWFTPESQSFHSQLNEVAQNISQALAGSDDTDLASEDELPTTFNNPMDCMGPGMAQRRSPAQIRAIAIYRRMREQREREEREAAARARKRRNSGSRPKSRSRSQTRRASTSSRAGSRSRRRSSSSRSRTRSAGRNRSTSRSRRR